MMKKVSSLIAGGVLAGALIITGAGFAQAASTNTVHTTPHKVYSIKKSSTRSFLVTFVSASGTTLTVTPSAKNSTITTVDASKAKYVKDGVSADISTLVAGDKLIVIGVPSGTTITATRIIQGMSVLSVRHSGPLEGAVSAISGSAITLTVGHNRGASASTVTVTTDSSTKFDVPGVKNASLSDISVGDTVFVLQGPLDTTTNTAKVLAVHVMPKTSAKKTVKK